jgi:hypothetical protein
MDPLLFSAMNTKEDIPFHWAKNKGMG